MRLLTDLINHFGPDEPQEEEPDNQGYSEPFANLSERETRIIQEVHMIAPRFSKDGGGIEFDEKNYDYIIINRFALPQKWKARWCRLMIIFPVLYPSAPPIGFYLDKSFKLKGNQRDEHFIGGANHGAVDLREFGWHWYCITVPNAAWQPQTDNYTKPDNLWTFLNMVREALTSDS